ncbi:hypothetical protein [Archaeoglobus sulfaticallidus]|uniref:hypothetical protein n=1 Tax=Archaeoglobus sulfaticallidus TaxID=1316941 RepID=UPI000A4487E2|nr:hypothetical protein [Archaeoglobus sulfaticallidus]
MGCSFDGCRSLNTEAGWKIYIWGKIREDYWWLKSDYGRIESSKQHDSELFCFAG